MTPKSEETDTARVEVAQADRDAAAAIVENDIATFGDDGDGRWISSAPALIRAGNGDDWPLVQAFARHRLAQASPAEVVTNSAWPASARYTVVTPTIPEEWGDIQPLRIDWNKFDLAEAYDLVEGVRRAAAQDSESPISTSLCAALDAIEAADCEWDGLTKSSRDE